MFAVVQKWDARLIWVKYSYFCCYTAVFTSSFSLYVVKFKRKLCNARCNLGQTKSLIVVHVFIFRMEPSLAMFIVLQMGHVVGGNFTVNIRTCSGYFSVTNGAGDLWKYNVIIMNGYERC